MTTRPLLLVDTAASGPVMAQSRHPLAEAFRAERKGLRRVARSVRLPRGGPRTTARNRGRRPLTSYDFCIEASPRPLGRGHIEVKFRDDGCAITAGSPRPLGRGHIEVPTFARPPACKSPSPRPLGRGHIEVGTASSSPSSSPGISATTWSRPH
jgi:hypothetical protein